MLTQDEFDLDIVVTHLAGLCPEAVAALPLADLEWILADFVINWGQRLVLEAEAWPAPAEREAPRLFGQSWWPLFIAPDFPRVSDEQLRTLTLAATCFHLYIIYQDEAMDNPDSTPPGVQLAIPYVLERFYHLAAMLFAPDSRFWDEVRQVMVDTSHAMLAERRRQPPRPLNLDEYLRTARGRVAFTRFSTIGLALLDGSADKLPMLTEVWNALSMTPLVDDDIGDWKEDYANQTYSYLHSRVLFSPPFRAEVEAGRLPDVREMGVALFFSDVAESLYDMARDEVSRAQTIATQNGYHKLVELGARAHARLARRRNELAERKVRACEAFVLERRTK
jgi:hypothetical protein